MNKRMMFTENQADLSVPDKALENIYIYTTATQYSITYTYHNIFKYTPKTFRK